MEYEGSSPCSQKSAIGSYHEPAEFSSRHRVSWLGIFKFQYN